MEAVGKTAAKEETGEKTPSHVRAIVACAAVTLLCGVGVWLTDRHYRMGNQFDHSGTAVEMNADDASTPLLPGDPVERPKCEAKSSIALYTGSPDKSGTDSGLYFCNGFGREGGSCEWLDNPGIDDFQQGKVSQFDDINTIGGSPDWFCLCGTRDRWQGKINEIDFCGQSLSVEPRTLDLSAYIYDTTAYECSKYQVSDAGVISDVRNARFAECDLYMWKLTMRTDETSSEDYPDNALSMSFGTGYERKYPIDRVGANDFQRGQSSIFTVPTSVSLNSRRFKICTDSDKVYAGELRRISAPYKSTQLIFVPTETPVVFTIAKQDSMDNCAEFEFFEFPKAYFYKVTGTGKRD